MLNTAQEELVMELIEAKMRKYRKPQVKLNRLHETICRQANDIGYVNCNYTEFKNLFVNNYIKNTAKIPTRRFEITESGFLDNKNLYPYDIVGVTVLKKS